MKNKKKTKTKQTAVTVRSSNSLFRIAHNAPCLPPKILHQIIIVSNFFWVLQSSREKLKSMVMQNFGRKQGTLQSM